MHPLHPRLKPLGPMADALFAAADAGLKAAEKHARAKRNPQRYRALRPGAETPIWNALAAACARHLTKRGDKARLARWLGLSRQRLHLLLVSRTACPDAERALQLLLWLRLGRKAFDVQCAPGTMSFNK
jgi:hypothetical protein